MQQHSNDDHLSDLILHIEPPLRRRLRLAAAQSHLSEEEYVGRLLEHVVPPENESVQQINGRLNRAAVEDLKQYCEAIRRSHPGQVFEDSVVLPWNMVDKSPSPLQTDFGAVFVEETVSTGLLSPE